MDFLPFLDPGGGFTSETATYDNATWVQELFKNLLELLESSGNNKFFPGGDDDGRVYRNICKIPRGSHLNQGG
jgi:hypothetical protein